MTNLDEIAAYCERATAGPWTTDGREVLRLRNDGWQTGLGGTVNVGLADAEFIARARTDLPRIAAELKAARAAYCPHKISGQEECEYVEQYQRIAAELQRARERITALETEHAWLLGLEKLTKDQAAIMVAKDAELLRARAVVDELRVFVSVRQNWASLGAVIAALAAYAGEEPC